jgi:epoxyqueuosine reductase QueG
MVIMKKTYEQIVQKVRDLRDNREDILGFQTVDLVSMLPYSFAKEFLSGKVSEEEWKEPLPYEEDKIVEQMREYMSFAWDKANNKKGISASRSMSHYTAWIFLLNDEDNFPNLLNYEYYGKENLAKICAFYGFSNEDDGVRENE